MILSRMNTLNIELNFTLIIKNKTVTSDNIKNYLNNFGNILKFDIKNNNKKKFEIFLKYGKLNYLDLHQNYFGYWKIKEFYENGASNFLKVFNLNENSLIKIFSLFSSFGNVWEIYRKKNQTKEIILKFETLKGAIVCKKFMDELKFKDKVIKIIHHKYFIFNNSIFDKLIIKKKFQRFSCKNPININTPNKFLYFYNIKKSLRGYQFFKLLKEKFNYFKFKLINNKKEFISYIVEFKNKDKAMEAIMYFHNKKLENDDIIVKVSFTHSQF